MSDIWQDTIEFGKEVRHRLHMSPELSWGRAQHSRDNPNAPVGTRNTMEILHPNRHGRHHQREWLYASHRLTVRY